MEIGERVKGIPGGVWCLVREREGGVWFFVFGRNLVF